MKANELSEGIYVYFNCFDGSKIIVKVTGFKDGVVYGISEYGTHWCQISKIEPIPLTAEMLKKNGFSNNYAEDNLSYAEDFEGDVIAVHIYGKYGTMDEMRFDYVHQLQHALRLYGIGKEIKL